LGMGGGLPSLPPSKKIIFVCEVHTRTLEKDGLSGTTQGHSIKVANMSFESVPKFKYLGTTGMLDTV
jgi:hypothetical protein